MWYLVRAQAVFAVALKNASFKPNLAENNAK